MSLACLSRPLGPIRYFKVSNRRLILSMSTSSSLESGERIVSSSIKIYAFSELCKDLAAVESFSTMLSLTLLSYSSVFLSYSSSSLTLSSNSCVYFFFFSRYFTLACIETFFFTFEVVLDPSVAWSCLLD